MKPAWWQVLMRSLRVDWGPCPLLMTPTVAPTLQLLPRHVSNAGLITRRFSGQIRVRFCLLIKLRCMQSPAARCCWLFRNAIFPWLDASLASTQRRVMNGPWRPGETLTWTVGLTGGAAQIKRWLSFWEANFYSRDFPVRGGGWGDSLDRYLSFQHLVMLDKMECSSTSGITSTGA